MDTQGQIFIFIPNPFARFVFKITRTDGTIDTITDSVISIRFDDRVFKEGIGSFEMTLDNNNGAYESYAGNEDFNVYMDYVDATTLFYSGKVEKISRQYSDSGKRLILTGSFVSYITLDTLVTLQKTDTITNTFNYLVDNYMTGFTHNNVDTISTSFEAKWNKKPLIDCIYDICINGNADGFFTASKDAYLFPVGSKETVDDAIVSDDNLLDSSGIGTDISDIKNTVSVEGKNQEGLPILFKSTDSSSPYNTKEKYVSDEAVTSDPMAADRAANELNTDKTALTKGDGVCLPLAKTPPGYKIWISNPEQQLNNQYVANIIEHRIAEGDHMKCYLTVAKSTKGVSKYFKERFRKELEGLVVTNPNNMNYSANFDFDTEEGTHSSTALSGGNLTLASGASNGVWTSNLKSLPENVSSFEIRVSGNDLNLCTVQVSSDNGQNYSTSYNLFTQTNSLFSIPSGKDIVIKIAVSSSSTYPNPYLASISVLFR